MQFSALFLGLCVKDNNDRDNPRPKNLCVPPTVVADVFVRDFLYVSTNDLMTTIVTSVLLALKDNKTTFVIFRIPYAGQAAITRVFLMPIPDTKRCLNQII